jgi:hypothetical protein
MLKVFKTNKEINDKVLSRAEQDNEMINGGESKTATTSTGFQNPYGDIKSLRYKVDNGMASILMQKDLDEAAHDLAYRDAKQDIDANPYAVLADKHQYSMQQIAARNAGLERAARLRNKGEMDKVLTEAKLKAGTHRIDEETGQVIPIEAFNEMYAEPNDKGNVTDKLNFKELSNQISRMKTQEYALPYLQNTVALVERFVTQGTMTKQQASEILGYSRFKNISVDKFSEKLNGGNAQGFIKSEIGSKDLAQIEKKMNTWLTQNGELSGLSGDEYKNYQSSAIKFSDYNNYLKANQDWLKKTSKIVINELSRQGYKNASLLYDENGDRRTREEYNEALVSRGISGKDNSRDTNIARIKDNNKKLMAISREYAPYEGSNIYKLGEGRRKAMNDPRVIKLKEENERLNKKVGGYNLLDYGGAGSDYDDLVKAAGSVYSSDKISKTPGKLPGIDQIGELSGTGLFTTGMNATWVNPKSVSTKGNLWFNQVLRDYNKVDWGDTTKNRVTFNGISKTSFDERSEKGFRNNEGKALLDAIRAEMIDPKTKMGNFRIGVSPIAAGKVSKAAIVIHPDAEWLKGYVYNTKDGKATSAGMISQDQYNLIMKHGISYITDAQNMSNELYTQAYKSPLASYVDYYGSYTYTDPANPKYKLNITKNKTGTGDYNTLIEYPLYNPQTGEYTTQKVYDNLTTQGGNIEKSRNEIATDYFPRIKEFNIQLNNQAYE